MSNLPPDLAELRRSAQFEALTRASLFFRSLACPKCEKAGRTIRGRRHDGCAPWMSAASMLLTPWMLDEIASGKAAREAHS